eukprot:c26275_g1_i3 orf=696-1664(-)
MSYITDRLVAMSYPAEDMRAMFRNPIWQVRRALDARYGSHYKIYNLCAEACYDPMQFYGRVEFMPFDDMHAPPLSLIKQFCESVQEWLAREPANVAVVHCMAGKGRTGCMVCAYLVYIGMPVDEALQLYADRRTYNNEGVTIASQRRYVSYWSKILYFSSGNPTRLPEVHLPPLKSRELRRIRLYDAMDIDRAQFTISELREIPGQLYQPAVEVAKGFCRAVKKGYRRTVSPRYFVSFLNRDIRDDDTPKEEPPHVVVQMDTERPVIDNKACLDHYFEKPLPVSGDVRLSFFDKTGLRLFYACFNIAFIVNSMLQVCLTCGK